MANKHTTLSSLFTAIADAIRTKNETTESIVADNFPDAIAAISTGVELPVLSNPATADIIPSGYDAVDGDGNLIEGTGAGLGNATVGNVDSGVTFTSANGLKLSGTSTKKDVVTGTCKPNSSGNSIFDLPDKKNIILFKEVSGNGAVQETTNVSVIKILNGTVSTYRTGNYCKPGSVSGITFSGGTLSGASADFTCTSNIRWFYIAWD